MYPGKNIFSQRKLLKKRNFFSIYVIFKIFSEVDKFFEILNAGPDGRKDFHQRKYCNWLTDTTEVGTMVTIPFIKNLHLHRSA